MPPGEVGAKDAYAGGVDHRIGRRVADSVEPVLALLPGIDVAAELAHLRREGPSGGGPPFDGPLCHGLGAGEHHPAVAVAPAPIVEQHDQIAGARQVHSVLTETRGRRAPAGRHDHRGQLPALVPGGVEPLGRQAHVLADEVGGLEGDPLRRAVVVRRGQALQRGGIDGRVGGRAVVILQRPRLGDGGEGHGGERAAANP